jgi:hypothetical protein
MRRIIFCLMFMALVALAGGGGTAVAAQGQTFRIHMNGSFAEALWETQQITTITDTFVYAESDLHGGTFLFLDKFTAAYDLGNGNFTGATEVVGEADSGVSFSSDAAQLSSAAASADVPATSCSYDANFNLAGCIDVTVDVSGSWTGQGPIARGTFNQNFRVDGFHEVDRFRGTDRQATATATVGGIGLGTGDLVFADLGTAKSGSIVICHNC